MGRRRRATIRGIWWKEAARRIRHCGACGGKLVRRYVKVERSWRRVCRSCGFITYLNPKVTAGILPILERKLVLGRRAIEPAKGYWTFPSGYVELGESARQAAEREALEEIGIPVKAGRLLGVYSYADAGVVTVVYLGVVRGRRKPKPTHETLEVRLFEPGRIPWPHLAFRSTGQAIRDWIRISVV